MKRWFWGKPSVILQADCDENGCSKNQMRGISYDRQNETCVFYGGWCTRGGKHLALESALANPEWDLYCG